MMMGMGNKHVTQEVLLEEIERIREIMIYTALKEGLVSDNTVKVSQVLDRKLNELEEIY
ncbi:Spo0E family sporulation regulatory protein-aspartic acid phosphatase [Priestia megaterium]|nr:Spo0E family sporulation regulatory protein-aspartic acid phosphatase [Priestia megaterium]PEE73044.1 Spo0E family sporulation regulatory protein-aspartic acid phosphatase [Priestia megaterium]PFI95543.1 Spo0E family sporulation regulatory protein-aspartic acid phosphatase [Priestia megaterium]PGR05841.1 Spo0E family sporulation regulatory protein-aspartic acid phosphatase [Priestia megaterium]